MTHAEMNELYELYVLGALEPDLASEIDNHVAEQCEYCLAQIHNAAHAAIGLSVLAEPVAPPENVRARLLASLSVRPLSPVSSRPRASVFSWAVPLLAVACLAIILLSVYSTRQLHSVNSRLARVAYERDQLRAAVEMLSRRETRTIQFSERANPAHGSVLVNRNGGVVLVGSDLPALPENETYELWAIPAKGAPIPEGLFRVDDQGNFLHVAPQPANVPQLAAVAVSVEPRSGSPAPTTKPILVVPLT